MMSNGSFHSGVVSMQQLRIIIFFIDHFSSIDPIISQVLSNDSDVINFWDTILNDFVISFLVVSNDLPIE
jgi:hypothetical protein